MSVMLQIYPRGRPRTTPVSDRPLAGLHLAHAVAQAVGSRRHQSFGRLLDHESRQRYGRVDSEIEPHDGGVPVWRKRVAAVLSALLFRAHQRPAHTVVLDAVVEHLLVGDAYDLDHLARLGRAALFVSFEDLDLLMG